MSVELSPEERAETKKMLDDPTRHLTAGAVIKMVKSLWGLSEDEEPTSDQSEAALENIIQQKIALQRGEEYKGINMPRRLGI